MYSILCTAVMMHAPCVRKSLLRQGDFEHCYYGVRAGVGFPTRAAAASLQQRTAVLLLIVSCIIFGVRALYR